MWEDTPHSLKDGIASQDWKSKKGTSKSNCTSLKSKQIKARSNIEVRLDYTIWI